MIGRGGTIARPTGPSAVALWRLINTSSTAYPSGSVRHPTQIMTPSVSTNESANRWQKSRTVPASHRSLPELPVSPPPCCTHTC
ncbi:uncharacterized protein VP01_811g3 [Puccinia sorghi]|uniref:Uncharacterized protein n=1 Tax=Puccinia sorghi TaxID=27349 RepID=A0A0L6UB04_9BASI|nr:uncharacterized protein VP01_811g3 [Puccinia sorghi]